MTELGSSYSVLAASEPSAGERLNLAQEHRLAEYASEGPPALAGLQFHFLSSCLHVSSWAEDAEFLSTLETHVGTSLRRRRAGSHDPGEGVPLRSHGAPHSCPLPTVFLTTPHLIGGVMTEEPIRGAREEMGVTGRCWWAGGNELAQGWASVGWGASEKEVCGQPGL